MKVTKGNITNVKTGKSKNIIVKSAIPTNLRDALIGGLIVATGIWYLTTSAFKNGAKRYEEAEMDVFEDLDLIMD